MKKQILSITILLLLSSAFMAGCSGNGKKAETAPAEVVKDQYKCPMKCSEQLFDKPGKCPECGMTLEKVTKS
jgi:nitrous oxide reductase accessory protein NosL